MDRNQGYGTLAALRGNIGRAFVGSRRVVDHLLAGLLAGGHVLIQDVPGVGKTTLARARAFLDERDYVVPDDIKEMAVPVLAHRLGARGPGGEEHESGIVREVLSRVNVPD